MGFLEQFGLKFEGLSDAQIAKLIAIEPDLAHLALVLRAEMPRVNRIAPVLIDAIQTVVKTQQQFTAPAAPAVPAYEAKPAAKPAPKAKKFF